MISENFDRSVKILQIPTPDQTADLIPHQFQGCQTVHLTTKWDLLAAHDTIIANCIKQTFHWDHMYLSTQNLTLPKGRARKLVPKYIGPYKVVKAHNEASTIMLKLPPGFVARWISLTFHMGLIQRYVTNSKDLFPKWDMKSIYDFSQDDKQEWLVEEITSHRWSNSK